MRNLELKARLADLEAARKIAARLATESLGVQHQLDTYFHCSQGRLKLREIDGLGAELIAYERPNEHGLRLSHYQRVPVTEAASLKRALAAALGVRCVVDKRREIFLVENVRIHLDEVVGRGTFLEFEAVLETDAQEAAAEAQLQVLRAQFGLQESDLLPGSYGDEHEP